MSRSIIYSIFLHVLIIALILFGLPNIYHKSSPKESVITVDLLPIKDISNVETKHTQKQADDKPNEAKTIVKATNEIAKEEKEKKEEKKQVQESPKVPNEPVPLKKEEKKKEEPKKEVKEEKIEKKEEKKKEKPKKEQNIDLNAWMKSLEDNAELKTDKATKNKTSNPQKEVAKQQSKSNIFNPDRDLSISEYDNIKRQIEDVWQYPSGSKDAEKMTVLLKITIERDGVVSMIKHIGGENGGNAQIYEIVVESTIRAVKKASPILNLNISTYGNWHDLNMNFDVRDLIR